MAYFNYLPNISLAIRPIRFPWSEQQYQTAKNIFKRFKVADAALDSLVYYKQYTITDADRPDIVSHKVYGSPGYDWVVLLSNNIINPYFDWPMPTPVLQDYINKKYEKPFDVKHYETNEVKNTAGDVVLPAGQLVGEDFYKAPYWTEYDDAMDGDAPKPESAIEIDLQRKIVLTGITVDGGGSGYESAPTLVVDAPQQANGDFPTIRAEATASLSATGHLKRFNILSGGEGYTYPPDITLTGGMSGESATAVIDKDVNSMTYGQVIDIRLDGTSFDTTVADNIHEFGEGATIAPNGTGQGAWGGFNVGSTHLRFGDTWGVRYCTLNKVDMTNYNTVRVYAIRGNGMNGGETPDIPGVEELRLRYQVTTDTDPDPDEWVTLGIVIEAVPNGTGTGVLEPYDFEIPADLKVPNVFFQLYQPGNSGPQYDHFGITSINFIDTSKVYGDSGITFTNNVNDTVGQGAAASVILGKSVDSIAVTNQGSYGAVRALGITATGGNQDTSFSYTANTEESPTTFSVGETVTFANGAAGEVTSYTGTTMGIKLTAWDSNNPVTPDMILTGTDTSATGVVTTFNASTFTEPTWMDKDGNKFRYKLTRLMTGTSGWEKLIRDSFRYRDPSGSLVTLQGSSIVDAVTHHEFETRENDKKRKIYILRQRYLMQFIEEMKLQLPYKSSSDYVSKSLKRSAS
tara:strand:- start:278 stop:2335 length:2058 start_codon:yes stop_codon:yes gene_type:complete